MREYCNRCHASKPVDPADSLAQCRCGHADPYPGEIMTIKAALRRIKTYEADDGHTERGISFLRRYVRETVHAGWAWNYRRAIQLKGQDWGIRVVW